MMEQETTRSTRFSRTRNIDKIVATVPVVSMPPSFGSKKEKHPFVDSERLHTYIRALRMAKTPRACTHAKGGRFLK